MDDMHCTDNITHAVASPALVRSLLQEHYSARRCVSPLFSS